MNKLQIDTSANLEPLINKQMHLWEVRQKMAREGSQAARHEFSHLKEGPWITLSHQPGSGGGELARILAKKLGWQVWDKEIITAIAHNDPARERMLSRLDGHAVGALQEFLTNVMVRGAVSRNGFAHELAQVIWTLARQGRAIMIGRGANWLLDSRHGLRLRAMAPPEVRAHRIARERNLELSLAEETMRSEDEQFAGFIRQLYHRDINDPLGYDLVLNLGGQDLDLAADIIVAAVRRKLGEMA